VTSRYGPVRLRYDSKALGEIFAALNGGPVPAGGYSHELAPFILDRCLKSLVVRCRHDDLETVEIEATVVLPDKAP
jgi:hypothetical protein